MSDEKDAATTAPLTAKLRTTAGSPSAPPTQIGRYRVERLLGQGGFGLVYLAYDDQLNRQVAIKVPHAHLVADRNEAELYLAEARTVANLDHANIVPVHDVGSTDEIPCFIVAKYIDGTDLAACLSRSRLSIEESMKLVATVAEALHHAHKQGLVHRDVKPGNILLDRTGKPFVTDFGLALREQDIGKEAEQAGTPPYMSPEQARGEGHRVDARSDIFSVGVVLYQLLVGRKPFRGDTKEELLDQIINQEPRPPRQFDDRIPLELERICMKALAKRASERYSTAHDMAEDLSHLSAVLAAQPGHLPVSSGEALAVWRERAHLTPAMASAGITTPSSLPGSAAVPLAYPNKIVPKGLRSYDEHDADFFLELLPGPRDREGLPDGIRFWKTHIEETDADKTFPVGLIYGPSGCGKSSQVKAGLLPRLAAHVLTVYLEATPHQTELRLLNGLRKRCPVLPDNLDLKRSIALLRRGQGIASGRKVLIVVDQFEQWLHGRTDEQETELVQALRQCDGGHVQCVVMVRDDFWMAATRFMGQLEVPLVEGHNSAAIDLFPLRHAEKVLASFGRAFGCLPENSSEMTADERQFLTQAVSALAQEGKVICVRLALFSEMTKGRPWKTATLKEMGGAEGVGVAFLEETFTAASALPQHRHHQKAARAVLKALLPDSGSEIKGHLRARSELAEASGYSARPGDFDDLIRMLDVELRLIAPTDPTGVEADENAQTTWNASHKYYQLSHDYLVPSLRDWLTRKQKETRVGRAELLLADRTEIWNTRKESRQLPSIWEFAVIVLLTRRKGRAELQRRMIRSATRHYLARGTAAVVLASLLLAAGWQGWRWNAEQRASLTAQALLERVLGADTPEVPALLAELEPFRHRVNDKLESVAFNSSATGKQGLHASLALLPDHSEQKGLLEERLLRSWPQEIVVIRGALGELADRASHEAAGETLTSSEFFWQVLTGERRSADERFRAAAALAGLAPRDERWAKVDSFVADTLTRQDALFLNDWIQALRPSGAQLIEPLCSVFRDAKRTSADRSHSAVALAEFAADDLPKLAQLLVDADAAQFAAILPKLELRRDEAVDLLRAAAAKISEPKSEVDKDVAAARQANAAVALALLGEIEGLWPLLAHRDDPRLRTYLVHRLVPLGVDAEPLVARLVGEPDPSVRQALLLALSRLAPESLPAQLRNQAMDAATALYHDDVDPGVHAAAEYLVQRWNHSDRLASPDELSSGTSRRTTPGWYTDHHKHTMVVIPGPVTFEMGARPDESGSFPPPERLHLQRIGRSFAVGAKEVTVEQFLSYDPSHPWSPDYSPEPGCPINNVSWYDAARYCRWLSEQEGIEEHQMCFPAVEQIREGVRLPADYLTRTGYRLPTEAEWEYVFRAGATTSRCFGESEELLAEYAWTFANSQFRNPGRIDSRYCARPVGSLLPNDLGMFDILGNAMEWCQERYRPAYVLRGDGRPADDEPDTEEVVAGQRRPTRGGAYLYQPSDAKAPHRDHHPAGARQPYMGFRVARTVRD